jgi:hypothetical protein
MVDADKDGPKRWRSLILPGLHCVVTIDIGIYLGALNVRWIEIDLIFSKDFTIE